MSETVQLTPGTKEVDLTRKSNLILRQTRPISDNLKCTIFVDSEWAKTEGKAQIIDQSPLSADQTKSTILAQTKSGQFVALETVHAANEDVAKQFERVQRATEDLKIQMYPIYMMLVIFGILYGIMFKKMLVDKEPILIETSQWLDIILVSVIFLMAEWIVYYWGKTQFIQVTIFKSYTLPKPKTYEIRFQGHAKSISATFFHGMFFTLNTTTAKKLWGHSVVELEEYLVDENGDSFVVKLQEINADKLKYEKKIVDAYHISEVKNQELSDLENKFSRNIVDEADEFLKESEINEMKKENSDIINKKAEVKKAKNNYAEIKAELYPKWEKTVTDLETIEKKYLKKLNEIMDEAKDEKIRIMLVNYEKHISNLKHENSMHVSDKIGLINMIHDAYDQKMITDDRIMEYVYSLAQEQSSRNYQIQYTIHNQNVDANGHSNYSNGNGNNANHANRNYSNYPNQGNKGSGDLLEGLIGVIKWFVIIAGTLAIIFSMGWVIPKINSSFGALTPLAIIGIFLFIIGVIVVFSTMIYLGSRASDKLSNTSKVKMG